MKLSRKEWVIIRNRLFVPKELAVDVWYEITPNFVFPALRIIGGLGELTTKWDGLREEIEIAFQKKLKNTINRIHTATKRNRYWCPADSMFSMNLLRSDLGDTASPSKAAAAREDVRQS